MTGAVPAGGEGSNRWIQVTATGLRPRDLRQLFDSCGLEANRILRTRFGPVSMDRALARGRSRRLTDEELAALQDIAGPKPATAPASKPARRPGRRSTGSRKPAR
jgi:23S rRNA pseudouridine2605 synthase